MPREQYDEIVSGRGGLVDWLRNEEVKQALLLAEDADPALVAEVTLRGYGQLDEVGLEKVGTRPVSDRLCVCGQGAEDSRYPRSVGTASTGCQPQDP